MAGEGTRRRKKAPRAGAELGRGRRRSNSISKQPAVAAVVTVHHQLVDRLHQLLQRPRQMEAVRPEQAGRQAASLPRRR